MVLKFCQRRLLIGDSARRRGKGSGPSGPVGDSAGIRSGASILVFGRRAGRFAGLVVHSHLPRFEIDARIDPGVGQIGNQINDQPDKGENVEVGEHHRIIAVEHALEAQQPEAVERKDGFDQERPGEERADESGRESRQ